MRAAYIKTTLRERYTIYIRIHVFNCERKFTDGIRKKKKQVSTIETFVFENPKRNNCTLCRVAASNSF